MTKYLHYEYYQPDGTVQLHIEYRLQWDEYRYLREKLRLATENKQDYRDKLEWVDWGGGKNCRCIYRKELTSINDILDAFKFMIGVFDNLILELNRENDELNKLIARTAEDLRVKAINGEPTITTKLSAGSGAETGGTATGKGEPTITTASSAGSGAETIGDTTGEDAPSDATADDHSDVTLLDNVHLNDLLQYSLAIPDYQRIYCWEDKHINDLWNSIVDLGDADYHLGAIILHSKDGKMNIIDGQQRLVTLSLLLQALGDESSPLLKETFASAEALPLIKVSGKDQANIKKRFYNRLRNVFNTLNNFTVKSIANIKEQEYGN